MPALRVSDVVRAVLLEISRTHQPAREAVAPDDRLIDDLGLESLDVALAVAELEGKLGVDPFATDATIGSVRTVGDFIAVYERAKR